MTQLKRRLPIALAVLAILALLGPSWPGARLSVSTGSVEIGRGEPPVWKAAAAGDTLSAGDRVRTGENGRAEVALGGSTFRVYPNSVLRLPEQARQVDLEKGSSLFDVLHNGDPFEVRTPEVVVSVKGTRFGVSLEGDDASVSVFRGLVGVHADAAGAAETLVYAGFAAHGHDQFELSWHGSDDPWDGWGKGGDLKPPSRGAALRDAHKAVTASARNLSQDGKHERGRDDHARSDGDAGLPASIDSPIGSPTDPGTVVHDVVADADDTLADTLRETHLNGVLEQTTGGQLTINFVDGSGASGSDVVQVLDGTTTWVFDKGELKDIMEDDSVLPADLQAVLDAQNVPGDAFTNQLLSLFRSNNGND